MSAAPRDWSREREEALVARILESTTRADRGWRDDASLVGSFVIDRLRTSRPLRIAVAASLLLHLTAVPVLAWLWLRPSEPERVLHFGVEPREDWALAEEVEPERDVSWPELATPADPEDDNRARLHRFGLTRSDLPRLPASALRSASEARWGEWLRLRSSWADGRREIGPATLERSRLERADELELLLWAEAWMDALQLGLELPAWAPALWSRVADPAETGTSALAATARRRLAGLGLAERGVAGETPAPVHPFRAPWVVAIGEELRARGAASPAVEQWLQGLVQ